MYIYIYIYELVLTLSAKGLYNSESDVCRSQILTYKDDPHTVKNKIDP